MDNRSNTIAGWVLAACVTALGVTIASGMAFHAERPEKMGYPIEGVEEAAGGGAAAEPPIATLMATADVAKGAEVFKKCSACHSVTQGGANGVGPNLWGTMGKPLGNHPGFAYSEALKGKGGSWDFENMSAWLKSPRKFADGTKMTFAGLGNAEERANVIAYLNSNGSNLPMPAAPAAAPAGDVAEGASGNTADVANTAAPAPGAPSQDPAAATEAEKAPELPKK